MARVIYFLTAIAGAVKVHTDLPNAVNVPETITPPNTPPRSTVPSLLTTSSLSVSSASFLVWEISLDPFSSPHYLACLLLFLLVVEFPSPS